ncbi:MAG: hypothetical protein ACFCU4_04485 [Puniceicoccaceae bacterium]
MDRESAKTILSAYRPNGADALDTTFAAALEFASRDPEIATWLKDQLAFDQAAAAALGSLPSDREAIARIESLLDLEVSQPAPAKVHWIWRRGLSLGLAAILMIFLTLNFVFKQVETTSPILPLRAESFSLPALANDTSPVDFLSESPSEIITWLASNNAATPASLPPALDRANALGCRILPVEGGGSVSLLCFRKEDHIVHLFVFEGQARSLLQAVPNEWANEDGWYFRQLASSTSQSLALATQADPRWLDDLL